MGTFLKRGIRSATYLLVASGVFLLTFFGFHSSSHTSEQFSSNSPGIFPPAAHADAPVVTPEYPDPGDTSDGGGGGDDDDDDDGS